MRVTCASENEVLIFKCFVMQLSLSLFIFHIAVAGLSGIAAASGANPLGGTFSKQGSVLLVSNLDEDVSCFMYHRYSFA